MTDWKRLFKRNIRQTWMLSIVPMLVAYVIVFLYTFERIPDLFDPRCLGRDVLICLPALVVSAFIYWQISFIFGPIAGKSSLMCLFPALTVFRFHGLRFSEYLCIVLRYQRHERKKIY